MFSISEAEALRKETTQSDISENDKTSFNKIEDQLKKVKKSPRHKADSISDKGDKDLPVPKEIVYHDPGVQRNLNHILTKVKMKLSAKNLREVSFDSPEPATFGMIDKLLDDVFDSLDLLETTVARSYTFLGARDKEKALESYIIEFVAKKRKLELEIKEKEQQRNKLCQHYNKLENMCRNHKTSVDHLTIENGRLKESLQKSTEENEEKQKTIDDLRKLIIELEKPRKGRQRFTTWKVHNENNIDEIARLQKENKLLKVENEHLKQSLTQSMVHMKSENLKQLARLREDPHNHHHGDNEESVKPKINHHTTGIVFSESSQNMQVRGGHLHASNGRHSPNSHEYHNDHGKETEYGRDNSPSAKDKRVRFSDYSPTRYYNLRKPVTASTTSSETVNGYDSQSSVHTKTASGRHVPDAENESNEQLDDKGNDKANKFTRNRFAKSIGRNRARRSVSLNNSSSNRDPTKITTQIIKKTRIVNN